MRSRELDENVFDEMSIFFYPLVHVDLHAPNLPNLILTIKRQAKVKQQKILIYESHKVLSLFVKCFQR